MPSFHEVKVQLVLSWPMKTGRGYDILIKMVKWMLCWYIFPKLISYAFFRLKFLLGKKEYLFGMLIPRTHKEKESFLPRIIIGNFRHNIVKYLYSGTVVHRLEYVPVTDKRRVRFPSVPLTVWYLELV